MTKTELAGGLTEKKLKVPQVNLCDITIEPTDEELAVLMDCVRQKAVMAQEKAALALQAKLREEIRKAKELYAIPR